ncbi:MAG: terpene cyclase/mutase family protein [Proteobacteria bacterium]|nr:terpene cyclase/mutase family protein [Pseudomonadota bacterium]
MSMPSFRLVAAAAAALTLSVGAAHASKRGPMVDYESPSPITQPDAAQVTATQVIASRAEGIAWLKQVQRPDGGWGAGDWSTDGAQAQSDVATTSLTVLAMLRDARGTDKHDESISKAVGYVARIIEESPIDSAKLNGPEGTQPQYKLGQLVDTHMAAMMLGEIEGHFDGKMAKTVAAAHDKVLIKVQMAQNSDGSFDSNGWAPVLSTSIAASSLERAIELGKDVDGEVIAKNDQYQRDLVSEDGAFDTSAGAGVDLYAAATSLKGNRDARKRATDGPARQQAERSEEAAKSRITGDSSGALFSGFGSVGGEEMLSYMMISDTLAEDGGEDFGTWNNRVGQWLVASQNSDGSWAGHHCITSRTFTTAGALMALGAEDWAQVRAARVTGTSPDSMHADARFAPDVETAK